MMAGRVAATAAMAGLLVIAMLPFVLLFPDPPAFGPEALILVATFAVVATLATAWRARPVGRRRIMRRAFGLFCVTVATAVSSVVFQGTLALFPMPALLLALFGLGGENAETAILFEVWCDLWIVWALVAFVLAWCLHRRSGPGSSATSPWDEPVQHRPLNAATALLWAVGWCAMVGTVVEGHRTARFMAHADHAAGTIANDDDHPMIRFTDRTGTVVTFRQNGGIARAVGAAVPVVYNSADPAGTARADTFFVAWGNVAGLAWLGLGFTLFPFFGLRATFGRR